MNKKLIKIITASALSLSTIGVTSSFVDAKGGSSGARSSSSAARSSSVSRSTSSSKPSTSSSSSKPSSSNSSKPSSSSSSSKPSNSSSSSKPTPNPNKPSSNITNNKIANGTTPSKPSTYNPNKNSFNNNIYRDRYQDTLRSNYHSSGFFSGNSFLNTYLWWSLFNHSSNRNNVQASDKQKELVQNIKDSKTPVYMLEIKTKSGEIKHISVSKEQYNKVNVNDYIVIKDGELEVKPKEGN